MANAAVPKGSAALGTVTMLAGTPVKSRLLWRSHGATPLHGTADDGATATALPLESANATELLEALRRRAV
jgi:hypothetical protein